MKIFKDRQEAGKILAKKLESAKAELVLAIPRGGVLIGAEIAKALKIPLDVIVTRKIGAPGQEELALGAVDPDGEVVLDDFLIKEFAGLNLKPQIQKAWKELKRREELYRQGRPSAEVRSKTVILADDGMATGATVLSAAAYLKRHGAKVILAISVASKDALEKAKKVCNEIIVLEVPEYFGAVGQFYDRFQPVSDEEVIQYLHD